MISRRTLLAGAAGVVVAGLAVGEYAEVLPGGVDLHRLFGWTGGAGVVPDVPAAVVTDHRFSSAARGRSVELITMVPAGFDASRLPVCLVLHGRGNNAQGMVTLGLPQFLAAAVRSGVAPMALVAVDGGDSYWVADGSDDPQRMLADELPGWLRSLGFGQVSSVLGISMGCFGALVYVRGRPVRAVSLLSPALFRSWGDAQTVHAFSSEQEWAADEPLLHVGELPRRMRMGVWCGREDPFYPSAVQLVSEARPGVSSFPHGEHDDDFWRRMLPSSLSFLG